MQLKAFWQLRYPIFISHSDIIPYQLEGVEHNPSHCRSEAAGGVAALGGKYTVPTLMFLFF